MKNRIILILVISLLVLTGCNKNKVVVNGEKINTGNMNHKHCTRSASAGDGITTDLQYEVYYTDDILNVLESTEKIITNDSSTLDEYENAYKNINKNYEGLEYYDTTVERTNNSVLRHTTINYDKIDTDKLLKIEGTEYNIIENGKAKYKLWFDLAKKFGAKCEEVEE